jgi:hypothetical protein
VTCRYAFSNILPSLPGPGTPAFAQLCRELKRFGIAAERITFETPTSRLSDVRATISLLQDTVTLRLQYEWFELAVPALVQGQEDALIEIANIVLSALALMDENVSKGHLTVQSLAHLRLESGDPEPYIAEHLTGGDGSYRPDAFAFNLHSRENENRKGRIVIARSAIFDGSVFVDYVAEYPVPQFTPELAHVVRTDYNARLSLLGLAEAQP